ncbi:unnamed protein product [Alternaria alternata]
MDTTFITIHDLSDDAHILYSSDSIVDILGHTPDEVVNRQSERAVEAPIVRKLFASSPKDPRYHMLSHLSSKFDLGPDDQTHEPRAALFLNRFTRTLTVMYATSGIEQIIGISGEAMKGRSFYYCIAPNCLEDAVRCLESAKGNDSIAYMRFFFRDPRQDDAPDVSSSESEDDIMTDVTSDDESEGGVGLGGHSTFNGTARHPLDSNHTTDNSEERSASRTNSGDNRNPSDPHHVMFGGSAPRSSISSVSSPRSEVRDDPIELEAVISCTSDGLVVCLRRARPMLPGTMPVAQPVQQYNGIYAAPWATQPVFHPAPQQMPQYPLGARHPAMVQAGPSMEFQNNFMQSIRDVAVFAWALTGINGSLVDYARGKPIGESQPPEGFPVWNPLPNPGFGKQLSAAPSGYVSGSNSSSSNDPFGFGDPGLR